MQISRVAAWLGAVLLAILFLGFIVFLAMPPLHAQDIVVEAPPKIVQAPKPEPAPPIRWEWRVWIDGKFVVYRVVDKDTGVVCYMLHDTNREPTVALDCLPRSEITAYTPP